MKLYPLGSGASKFIEIKWDKIEELDVDGKEVQKVGNFASQAFIIRGPDEVIYDAGSFGKFNATRIILDATVTPSKSTTEAKFKVSIWAFKTDVTLPNGASTVTVPRDNVSPSAAQLAVGAVRQISAASGRVWLQLDLSTHLSFSHCLASDSIRASAAEVQRGR